MSSEVTGLGGEVGQGKERPKAGDLRELVGRTFCYSGDFPQDLVTSPMGHSTAGLKGCITQPSLAIEAYTG